MIVSWFASSMRPIWSGTSNCCLHLPKLFDFGIRRSTRLSHPYIETDAGRQSNPSDSSNDFDCSQAMWLFLEW
ncbi:hypothetical protein BDW66DRAFT_125916 [Aspergillus desertorum]